MTARRFLGFSALLCVAASCASLNQPAKQAIAAEAGPKAWIYANYSGGLLNRRVEPVFKVEQDAYVLVGHLGGDGQIEVLYPRNPRETGRVPGGKYFRTQSFSAYYDAAPQLYSFATTRFRDVGAQMDSYDGRGHGFVFLITSRYPMLFNRISSFGLWDEFEVQDYTFTHDPRTSINDFAKMLTGGAAYTLKYASSFGSSNLSSYNDYLFDCAFFASSFGNSGFSGFGSWNYGYIPYASAWGFFASSGRGYFAGCPQYGNSYAFYYRNPFSYIPPLTPGTPGGPGSPSNPKDVPLTLTRPAGFRRAGETGPALSLTRPTFNRPPTGTQAEDAPSDRGRLGRGGRVFGPPGTDFGDRSSPGAPRTYDPPHSTPTYDAPRSAPIHDSPRSSSPPMDRTSPAMQPVAPAPQPQPSQAPAAGKPSGGEEKKP
jgi:hypothetical protein